MKRVLLMGLMVAALVFGTITPAAATVEYFTYEADYHPTYTQTIYISDFCPRYVVRTFYEIWMHQMAVDEYGNKWWTGYEYYTGRNSYSDRYEKCYYV